MGASMEGRGQPAEGTGTLVSGGARLPLAMMGEGDSATVLAVRGSQDLRQRLLELGFVPGAKVKVVSRVSGNVLVSVKGATFGIGRDMAMHIVMA